MISSSDLNVRRHIQLYYSKLLSGTEFPVSELEESYRQMAPSIHTLLSKDEIDVDALSYCLSRVPQQILTVDKVIVSQDRQSVIDNGYDIGTWMAVNVKNRRRRSFCSPDSTALVSIITSDADIDDLVNILIAIQIEFTKIRTKLQLDQKFAENNSPKLIKLFGDNYIAALELIKNHPGFYLKTIAYQPDNYSTLVNDWWKTLLQKITLFGIEDIPVYFISSNLHSLLNIVGGYVNAHQLLIYDYLRIYEPKLYDQLINIQADPTIIRKEDFFYYVSNKYLQSSIEIQNKKNIWEKDLGIKNINVAHELFCDAQFIPISSLVSSQFLDPSIKISDKNKLTKSNAVIINIDYPLGFTAYLILNEILKTLHKIAGVYIVGKAAILQGDVGDVQIPNIVFDERLNNVISFDNVFNTNFPSTSKNFSVLNNQKAISVQGVILENKSQIDNYLKTNFNIIEMESGSYLTAIAQKFNFDGVLPKNQVCKLSKLPFDLGIVNYASDNPLSANLGQGAMAMRGIEPTYASLLAIVQRIVNLEETR